MAGYIGARSQAVSSTSIAKAQDFTATDTTPEVTIVNNTHEDTDGGREGKVIFKGQQSGGEESTLAEIEANHSGSSDDEKGQLVFKTNDGNDGATPTEAMRINSLGNVGIGTASVDVSTQAGGSGYKALQIESDEGGQLNFDHNDAGTGSTLGQINFQRAGEVVAEIEGVTDGATDNGRLAFRTQPDGGALTEAMRIDHDGNLLVGKTSSGVANAGGELRDGDSDYAVIGTSNGYSPFICNRKTSDGNLFVFRQDNSNEGIISVSGSTVTYGGFSGQHESSGIATNTPIGTVVSTIDELDTYPEGTPKEGQTRTDHAKVIVSNTEGDSAVYGVVSRFDEYDKVMVASVGIGSVRVTGACAKGDLLESNGDGTAKVQSDDVVRSKTIGKVTIGNSSTDVKLVSCVLYCG